MEGSLEGGTSRGVLSTNPLAAASSETRQNDLHVEDPEGSRVSCVAQRGEVWSHQRIRTFAAATDRRHDDLVARAIRVDPDPGRSRTGTVCDLHAHSPDDGPAASWLRRGQSHLHRPAAPTVRRIRPCSTSGPLVPCARRQERPPCSSFHRWGYLSGCDEPIHVCIGIPRPGRSRRCYTERKNRVDRTRRFGVHDDPGLSARHSRANDRENAHADSDRRCRNAASAAIYPRCCLPLLLAAPSGRRRRVHTWGSRRSLGRCCKSSRREFDLWKCPALSPRLYRRFHRGGVSTRPSPRRIDRAKPTSLFWHVTYPPQP